jgi:hypothetical protein
MYSLAMDIQCLENLCKREPGDYLAEFELGEMKQKYERLERIEKLGLRLIVCSQVNDYSTDSDSQVS